MKITVTKVIRELEKKHGWGNLKTEEHQWFVKVLIKYTIYVIMFLEIMKTLLHVLSLFSILIFGFALTFCVIRPVPHVIFVFFCFVVARAVFASFI